MSQVRDSAKFRALYSSPSFNLALGQQHTEVSSQGEGQGTRRLSSAVPAVGSETSRRDAAPPPAPRALRVVHGHGSAPVAEQARHEHPRAGPERGGRARLPEVAVCRAEEHWPREARPTRRAAPGAEAPPASPATPAAHPPRPRARGRAARRAGRGLGRGQGAGANRRPFQALGERGAAEARALVIGSSPIGRGSRGPTSGNASTVGVRSCGVAPGAGPAILGAPRRQPDELPHVKRGVSCKDGSAWGHS